MPISLSTIRRRANQDLLATVAPPQASFSSLELPAPDWWDWQGFVYVYHQLVDDPLEPVDYVRRVSPFNYNKPFSIPRWLAYHVKVCGGCKERLVQHGGFHGFMASIESCDCPFADVLVWLSGGWRIPLRSRPEPASKPNYPSLLWSPASMRPEVERMFEWGVLCPKVPSVINPAMAVIRDSELAEQCRILEIIGHPSPSTRKEDIDAINQHIRQLLAQGVEAPASVGILKEVKIRFCLDLSLFVNTRTKKWRFGYARVHDAVALSGPGSHLSKIDLQRYFHQLPLHPQDQDLLGVYIPGEIHPSDPPQPAGAAYSSAFAHFGGQDFPALANGVSAAASAILRQEGIPNAFMTDDFVISGQSYEECADRLDRAVRILQELGFRLNPDKVVPPSQQMVFLGVIIDTVAGRLSIPQEKLQHYSRKVATSLQAAEQGQLSVRELESLLGNLGWYCEVLVAGRARLHRIRKCIHAGGGYQPRPGTIVSLSQDAMADLRWWADLLQQEAIHPRSVPFWTSQPPVFCNVFSDAAGEVGYGLVVGDRVFQGLWRPEAIGESSCFKELVPVLLALQMLPPEASGRVVIINTDNLSNVLAINKGSCHSDQLYPVLFAITELAAEKEIYLVAKWVPREDNEFCDGISRHPWFFV